MSTITISARNGNASCSLHATSNSDSMCLSWQRHHTATWHIIWQHFHTMAYALARKPGLHGALFTSWSYLPLAYCMSMQWCLAHCTWHLVKC